MDIGFSPRDFLLTLLLKVTVAASIAALLARWNTLRRVLFTEERDVDQKIKLMFFLTPPLILGVTLRLVGAPYRFADLSLEGAFLMGLLGGRVVGPIGGAIITVPALIAHEWLAMPAASAAGLLGGLMRQAIPNKEDLWNFGPFTFLNIPKATLRFFRKAEISWEMLPLAACVGIELGRVALVLATKPKWLFAIDPQWNWWLCLAVIATLTSVAVPLKIWNNTRIEMNLERHQQLLLKARMDALSSQINPHFLFNTLNTVSALIRVDPDTARGVVLKLSNILRRILRKHETFVALKEELQFIDDYLDIEVARFDAMDVTQEWQWNGVRFAYYMNARHQQFLGNAALAQGIKDRYYNWVELSFVYLPAQAYYAAGQMMATRNYDLITAIPFCNSFGKGHFYLFRSAPLAGHGNFTSWKQLKTKHWSC